MADVKHQNGGIAQTPVWRVISILVLVVLSGLLVAIINGGPLLYFDSTAYIDNGRKMFELFGLGPVQAHGLAPTDNFASPDDGLINGSRSPVYSVFAAGLSLFFGIWAVPLGQFLVLTSVLFYAVSIIARIEQVRLCVWQSVAAGMSVAALGAMPFYVAFMMPDLFTALLMVAAMMIAVYWGKLRGGERFLFFLLACFCITTHLSHLPIALLLVPAVALVAYFAGSGRWWVPPLVLALALGVGVAERKAFSLIAQRSMDSEVLYFPFLTARMIEDQVGFTYLEENCPNPDLATCALYDALMQSDDPFRLTASHIIFEDSAELGSFQHLSPADQEAVANEQVKFALRAGLARPFQTFVAILGNTLDQAKMVSVEMTLQDEQILKISGPALERIGISYDPALRLDQPWLAPVDKLHKVVYVLAFFGLLFLIFMPGFVPHRLRMVLIFVALAIAINAFICGAVSQPASRYGARMIWLLPLMTTLVAYIALMARRDADEHGDAR